MTIDIKCKCLSKWAKKLNWIWFIKHNSKANNQLQDTRKKNV